MNDKYSKKIHELEVDNMGISIRKVHTSNAEIHILYISQISDTEKLSIQIIKPLLQYKSDEILTIDTIANSIIYVNDISLDKDENKIINYILEGNSIVLLPHDDKYLICNTKKIESREIPEPDIETTVRAPKDCFTENIDNNLSLIRYRIKDSNLRIDNLSVGKRTKTKVSIVYIKDVANPQFVLQIKNKLHSINIDGVLESGYIEKFLETSTFNLFPQTGVIERSDKACIDLLDGKICILVEGSNLALCAPKTFMEFLDSSDDHYGNIYWGIFCKFIRMISLLISLTLSSLYVAVVAFHPDILPADFIIALAASRQTVPFNSLMEATLMELVSEILREASLRLPKQFGSAIGIVGTIVIGQAAVTAGLVSPLMIIIVSLSTMCSFVAADYMIMNPIRLLKFMMIFITAVFGLFGFVIGLTFITINLISNSSFGVPYFAPLAPFDFKDFKNYTLSDPVLSKKRAGFLRTKDKKKQ